jgi:membrane dipeptidase
MHVIDAHCDVLSRLANQGELEFSDAASELSASMSRLEQGGVKLQFFAVYISDKVIVPKFQHLLEQIDLFYRKIASNPRIRIVKTGKDVKKVFQGKEIGALLTIEGVDALQGNFIHLRTLFYLGVRSIGITWNYANWAADGILEARKGGFTRQGKQLISACNDLGILLDAAHLSESGFWELTEHSKLPFIVSHANARDICEHPRNLMNEQIEAVIKKKGMIGLTFVPWFVDSSKPVPIKGLYHHIDHVLSLGGEGRIGFGSDFDGIEEWVVDLEHAGKYESFVNNLLKNYKQELVEKIMWRNWKKFLINNLPNQSF